MTRVAAEISSRTPNRSRRGELKDARNGLAAQILQPGARVPRINVARRNQFYRPGPVRRSFRSAATLERASPSCATTRVFATQRRGLVVASSPLKKAPSSPRETIDILAPHRTRAFLSPALRCTAVYFRVSSSRSNSSGRTRRGWERGRVQQVLHVRPCLEANSRDSAPQIRE